MSERRVAQVVVETLRELGVRHVFGVPSGGWVDYMEALRQTAGIDFVLATHEGGAAFMALVCGQLSGAPGVCFGTFGPGATNLATGVGGALLDRSPMIALTDEMPAALRGRSTQMGIDHQALFRPLTKNTTRLEAGRVREILYEAASLALSGRPGPVHVGLPGGLGAETAAAEAPQALRSAAAPRADDAVLAAALAAFGRARRPLLAVGPGAVRAGAGAAVRALAERFGMPVVLTPMAKGLLAEDHPCYAGVLFHALGDRVAETHRQADLVLAVGYDPVEFNLESWLSAAPVLNIDTVALDIDRERHAVAADVSGDIAASLAALLALPARATQWDLAALAGRRERMFAELRAAPGSFGPCAVLEILRELLPADGIMSCDVGAHTHLIGQKWPTPGPGLQLMSNGWSAMGFGIPAAIAAKLCRPRAPVCAVVGDGGFLMSAGELAVAARENLRIVFVLLTDNDLALIRIKQQRKGYPVHGTVVRARGAIGADRVFGVPVLSAGNAADLRAALARGFASDGPVIVEAVIDSREYDALVLRNERP